MSIVTAPEVQGPNVLVEVCVVDTENLIFARPDLIFSAFLFDQSCRWTCMCCGWLHVGTTYTFLLANNEVSLVGALCVRCRQHPFLRNLLIDTYSQIFPKMSWKNPMIEMPPVVQ